MLAVKHRTLPQPLNLLRFRCPSNKSHFNDVLEAKSVQTMHLLLPLTLVSTACRVCCTPGLSHLIDNLSLHSSLNPLAQLPIIKWLDYRLLHSAPRHDSDPPLLVKYFLGRIQITSNSSGGSADYCRAKQVPACISTAVLVHMFDGSHNQREIVRNWKLPRLLRGNWLVKERLTCKVERGKANGSRSVSYEADIDACMRRMY